MTHPLIAPHIQRRLWRQRLLRSFARYFLIASIAALLTQMLRSL